MAEWINFPVTGGNNHLGNVPEQDGDNLILASSIIGVSCADTAEGFKATLNLTGGLTGTILISTNPEPNDPAADKPASTGYLARFKNAITRGMTANPGGVKTTVSLPLDQEPNAKYDQAKLVYFKSVEVA